MARPKIEINKAEFEKLCGMLCTKEEIAGWFNCSEDTVERWCKAEYKETFCGVYKKYSAKGRISLRRNQFKLSETSAAMAIWLGKQYLRQRDADLGEEKLKLAKEKFWHTKESDKNW
jgi:AraC-like DNA-binding protein